MEPRFAYATGADGVSLCYMTCGDGVPLVIPPPAMPWSHIRREWEIDDWRHWYEHLGEFARIVRYDNRGSGSSDRDHVEYSCDEDIRDIETIVDALGLDRFALLGIYYSAVPVIQYAARHPDRVSHVMTWCGFVDNKQNAENPASQLIRSLVDTDYALFTETLCHQVLGWGSGDAAHRVAAMMREAMGPAAAQAHWDSHQDIDLAADLPRVQAPALVMHRREFPMLPVAVGRDLANRLPNARLALFEGASVAPFIGDMEASLGAMAEFLGVARHESESFHYRQSAGFRSIMFTDISGSTATTQAIGDERAHEIVRTHNEIVRRALHRFGGDEVKHTGDGIMASFTSAVAALECAIAIQRALATHSALEASHPPFTVRIGINAGEPLIEGGDLFGTAVQVASRICTRAEPRQILVSDVMRQLVAGKGFLFGDRGETELRGFEDPVRLWELRWNEAG